MLHTLTEISRTKKGRYALFFDGEFSFSLDDETYFLNSLKVGQQYEDKYIETIRETTEIKGAKSRALTLLGYKSYTRKMLVDKLCEKTDEEYATVAVDKMEDLGLIDDLDYALRFSRDLVNLRNYSLSRVKQELKKKGIAQEYIEQALQQFKELDVEQQIYKIIKRKYSGRLEDEKYRRRAINAMLRRGFYFSDINTVLRNLDEDSEYYDYSE